MQQVIVYKARPEAVARILGLLRKEDLNPVALDNPDGTQQLYSGFTYLVRIAVPKDEADKARSVLAQWEEHEKPTVNRLSRQFSIQIAYALLGLGIIYGIFLFLGQWSVLEMLAFVLVLLGFSFYLFVYIYKRQKRRRDPRLSPSHSGEDQQSEDISENSP